MNLIIGTEKIPRYLCFHFKSHKPRHSGEIMRAQKLGELSALEEVAQEQPIELF